MSKPLPLLSIKGFRVGTTDAGLRAWFGKTPSPDLTLVVADKPCAVAGVFTTNKVKAAPVLLDQKRLASNPESIRGVLVNTASANACTGQEGMQNAEETAALAAKQIGCLPQQILVMSTGIIGVQLPMDQMRAGIPAVYGALGAENWPDAAKAIMTTDTRHKIHAIKSNGYTMLGIAKGAGMIAPDMATMLSLIVTDAKISAELLQDALQQAVRASFNRIVVDGDMSTNDTVLALANGASGVEINEEQFPKFLVDLAQVCQVLARKVVEDGEGATKFITIRITGARFETDAKAIAHAIATSALVKTAFYGGDANWGRILAAAGRAPTKSFNAGKVSLWYNELCLVENGVPTNYNQARANAIAAGKEIEVRLELGIGWRNYEVWTCDFSHDYVSINGHYRT
jgi:glutamate N-acetyltransferase / amino-acid N-acetyltransferase